MEEAGLPRRKVIRMVSEHIFKGMQKVASVWGIGGISQGVASDVVATIADPNLSEEDFRALQADVASKGYELELAK